MSRNIMTKEKSYLQWLEEETKTAWWHDSADPAELEFALNHNPTGSTTNPVLVAASLANNLDFWKNKIGDIPEDLSDGEKTEVRLKTVVQYVASKFIDQYNSSNGERGYVCAQVNPSLAFDRDAMIATARRFNKWAPNIAVKFPATAAGLDALEDCIAEGITITSTVNFTVPQVVATAERHRKGQKRAKKAGKQPGECFAVIMIGRLDDYLRDVALDNKADVSESDIKQAGLAVTKRAYGIFKEKDYDATLLVAALRGTHHMEELAGAEIIMSIHPKYQDLLLAPGIPRELRIDKQIPKDAIQRLQVIPEFIKAYEPDSMKPEDFITYGVTQRTLTQFLVAGWQKIEFFRL